MKIPWPIWSLIVFAVTLVSADLAFGPRHEWWIKRHPANIVEGPHAGRWGNIVSVPWIGWHMRVTVNVAATEAEIREKYGPWWGDRVDELIEKMKKGHGPRHWVTVWWWQWQPPVEV